MASPERQWTLEELAKLYGYSTSRFSALYTEIFGISPINDILENRLNTAKRLLALKTYSVGQIAELCGFSSIHYFSKFFKSHTGKSPSEYCGK
jgi:transcriptional regulator GlxA family with amidase domain